MPQLVYACVILVYHLCTPFISKYRVFCQFLTFCHSVNSMGKGNRSRRRPASSAPAPPPPAASSPVNSAPSMAEKTPDEVAGT